MKIQRFFKIAKYDVVRKFLKIGIAEKIEIVLTGFNPNLLS
jgi:hypothetical protein